MVVSGIEHMVGVRRRPSFDAEARTISLLPDIGRQNLSLPLAYYDIYTFQ